MEIHHKGKTVSGIYFLKWQCSLITFNTGRQAGRQLNHAQFEAGCTAEQTQKHHKVFLKTWLNNHISVYIIMLLNLEFLRFVLYQTQLQIQFTSLAFFQWPSNVFTSWTYLSVAVLIVSPPFLCCWTWYGRWSWCMHTFYRTSTDHEFSIQ